MNERDSAQESMKLVDKAVQTLKEHFDCVQIFVSIYIDDHEYSACRGQGSPNARTRQIEEWVIYQNEKERLKAKKDFEEKQSEP